MIKYIGSKRLLVPAIREVVRGMPEVKSVLDLFSGTSRVGHALKQDGYQVFANDHNAYAATLARCYVAADQERVEAEAKRILEELDVLPGKAGYFTETFCIQSRFFQPQNGERVDAIREAIALRSLSPELEAVLLVSLMEAADRVDSTTGVQMAYLKQWAKRASNPLKLRMPELAKASKHGPCLAFERDALELLSDVEADLAYIDPPYNQHKYLGNYHVWESLVRWDKPEVYGTACKRIDCRTRSSEFNSKPRFEAAFEALIHAVRAKRLVISFSDEGYLSREVFMRILGARGDVTVLEHDYKRYVGAQIGIHNLKGEVVGKVSHLRNKEFLFVVDAR